MERKTEGGGLRKLEDQVMLCGWPSPCTPNGGRSMSIEKMDATGKTADGRKHTSSLEHAVKFSGWPNQLAGWNTPTSPVKTDGHQAGNNRYVSQFARVLSNISQPMRLKATGELLIGSSAQMDGGGPLKPEHSRWIQALPAVWDDCAVTAMQSMRKLRKRSSKQP